MAKNVITFRYRSRPENIHMDDSRMRQACGEKEGQYLSIFSAGWTAEVLPRLW
ncbi:MAG: hypothetical protein JXA97_14345 [Anaerolineales bacterium]|nr:hypothetical protein [Anaerolineales bacterium]